MSQAGDVYAKIVRDLGKNADAASTTGTAHAKLAALLSLVQGTTSIGTALKAGQALAGLPSQGSPGTVYTWSNWLQMDAAVASAGLIAHALIVGNTDPNWAVQVGVGGAGAEAAIWGGSQLAKNAAQTSQPISTGLCPPKVANGARVTMRFAYGGAPSSVSLSATIACIFQATPV